MNKNMEFPGKFLANYAATLLKCGATSVRIEKNVCRIAEAYGLKAEVFHHLAMRGCKNPDYG